MIDKLRFFFAIAVIGTIWSEVGPGPDIAFKLDIVCGLFGAALATAFMYFWDKHFGH